MTCPGRVCVCVCVASCQIHLSVWLCRSPSQKAAKQQGSAHRNNGPSDYRLPYIPLFCFGADTLYDTSFLPSCYGLSLPSAYFVITSPTLNETWTTSGLNVIKWAASADQGIPGFDVELLRLSTDGILPIARTGRSFAAGHSLTHQAHHFKVPLTWSALNINLQGIPPGFV